MAELSASAVLIPYYDTLHRFLGLPSRADLLEAEKQLWGLSNAVHGGGPAPASSLELRNRTEIIQARLGLKLWDG